MDIILHQTLKLACLIRDSQEGQAWRKAWTVVADVPHRIAVTLTPFDQPLPLIEAIHHLHKTGPGQTRPMLFPLVLRRAVQDLDKRKPRDELQSYPKNLAAYQHLTHSMALAAQLIFFFRRLAPGFPHPLLIYTLSDALWGQYDSPWELAWGIGEGNSPQGHLDARRIGLERWLPSIAQRLGVELNKLADSIKDSVEWQNLQRWRKQLRYDEQFARNLRQAQSQFRDEMTKAHSDSVPRLIWRRQVNELAERIYADHGQNVSAYASSFLEYEWLVEKIYWLISHLVFYENFAGITSTDPLQLQQVALGNGEKTILTALTSAVGPAVDVGRLVHIDLPESGHLFDGIYQIELKVMKYHPRNSIQDYLRARCLWPCHQNVVNQIMRREGPPLIIPAQATDKPEMRLVMEGADGTNASWDIRETLRLEMFKTMYF